MAKYYTAVATTYSAARAAIKAACLDNGWAETDDILTKGRANVDLQVLETESGNDGEGVIASLGLGISGATPATVTGGIGDVVRMGSPRSGAPVESLPATVHVFIFTDPDEVFVVMQMIQTCYFLGFGASGYDGRVWAMGNTGRRRGPSSSSSVDSFISITISRAGSGSTSSLQRRSVCLPFAAQGVLPDAMEYFIENRLDGNAWTVPGTNGSLSVGQCHGHNVVSELNDLLPNAWNGEAVLLPIAAYIRRPEAKVSILLQLKNARYVRVDNYDAGDIITLGGEQWMVFPGFRKNADARNGGSSSNHTGTFGWAVRYDP